ncbi:MAG TPA: superoxide dismutase [Bacteroidia bacterium]|jgi:Fe-Mn family superoxide dismutase|nr:superoxide dismutase [Bacteroidia bacterium]
MENNRRDFLKKSALLGLAGLATNLVSQEKLNALDNLAGESNDGGKFTLPALPYAYDALEPFIDAQTMQLHHDKHHQAYVDKLNKALETYKGDQTWNGLFSQASKIDPAIRNNGGGHYNHSLFWQLMKANPKGDANLPTGKLADAIIADFNTFDIFKKEFSEKSMKVFGSGWCWLIEHNGKLKITATPNQDNPLMDCVIEKGKPVLALDIWEHAYYLKYQNKRADYITAWWNVVNWQQAENQFTTK